jgi:hypothetical protein
MFFTSPRRNWTLNGHDHLCPLLKRIKTWIKSLIFLILIFLEMSLSIVMHFKQFSLIYVNNCLIMYFSFSCISSESFLRNQFVPFFYTSFLPTYKRNGSETYGGLFLFTKRKSIKWYLLEKFFLWLFNDNGIRVAHHSNQHVE